MRPHLERHEPIAGEHHPARPEPAPDDRSGLPTGTRIVAGLFAVSGVTHLVRPAVFEPLMPPQLGDPTPWILGSGVAELVCAAGLISRARWAPSATTATLLGVWVGNIHYASRVTGHPRTSPALVAAAWLRIPLQVPLLVWALRSPVRR